MKFKGFLITLCHEKAALLLWQKLLFPKILMPESNSLLQFFREKSGLAELDARRRGVKQ